MKKPGSSERLRQRILSAIEAGGPQSRASVAHQLGISRSTASLAISELFDDDLLETVDETRAGRGQPGRPGQLIGLRRRSKYLVGIDFGRLKLRVGLFDDGFGLVGVVERDFTVDIPALEAIEIAATETEALLASHGVARAAVEAVGIGVPGPVDAKTGELHAGSILARWVGTDVTGALGRRLDTPVYMDNDANLGILAESRIGAAQNSAVVLYVLLSVGVGLGIAIERRVFRGVQGIAGELGHVVTDESGPLCRCGSRGCLEAQISVNALAAALAPTHGTIGPDAMLELAVRGDLGARRVVADAAGMAGRAVGALCNYFNPDLVIVSGELMRAADVVLPAIREAMARVSLPRAIEQVTLCPAALGEMSELYGAAFFARQRALGAPLAVAAAVMPGDLHASH
ncbi:ROK family transcriptional regulator [Jiella sonneratiae]|uniref:ROK family transcriptional regulator n=1 Tax=Jiella sonneratiae TaxID=2816856 RepID=A0ABS3J4H4_9HYPH|nr:ROK family transcriptional regulator [Jiella sonneratiae]MBO0903848.1 ROK family transcriptional regulator [Jiella sonneratiae]